MIFRSKAPLRLGLAGGGTDTSPYSDIYGGATLNATISMYAYATIEPRKDKKLLFESIDRKESETFPAVKEVKINRKLDLLKGVYNRIVREFTKKPLSLTLSTYCDVPAGSGLGGSSTLVVAIIGAFVEMLKLPLGEYDIARLAYEIERKELKILGGKQDQYSATFGGFNYMEFYTNDKVIVNPLRVKQEYINELEHNLLLYYTGTTRSASKVSSKIIANQIKSIERKKEKTLEAMHKLKEQTIMMKEALLTGKIDKIGEILNFGWKYKKNLANEVSNPLIDKIYSTAMKAGATGGKISGAGGGGFMIFYCPKNTRYKVIQKLAKFGGQFKKYQFTNTGLLTWAV